MVCCRSGAIIAQRRARAATRTLRYQARLAGDHLPESRLLIQRVSIVYRRSSVSPACSARPLKHWRTYTALRWSRWLASFLRSRDQTELFVDDLQPDMLPFSTLEHQYQRIVWCVRGCIGGLMGAAFAGMIGWFLFGVLGGIVGGFFLVFWEEFLV